MLNDTILRPGSGGSRISYINYSSPTVYSPPGRVQSITLDGDVEEKNGRTFSFTIVNGDNFETFMLGQPYDAFYEKRLITGKTHFNFSIIDFFILQEGIYFVAGNWYYANTPLEVELENVILTWTYTVIIEAYYPGASMGMLLIILGLALVVVGIRKRKSHTRQRVALKLDPETIHEQAS